MQFIAFYVILSNLIVFMSGLTEDFIYRSSLVNNGLFYLNKTKIILLSPDLLSYSRRSLTACSQTCLSTQDCSAFSFSRLSPSPTIDCILVHRRSLQNATVIFNASWDYYQMTPNTMCGRHPICDRFKSYQGGKLGYGGCSCISLTTVSGKRPAVQSSTYNGGVASRAVDGNRENNWHLNSCTHTNDELLPWWRVDLGKKHYVGAIVITNRGDCCSERLDNAQLRVGMSLENNGLANPLCTSIPVKIAGGNTTEFPCDEGYVFGRYVIISIPGSGALTLCEVEVQGIKV